VIRTDYVNTDGDVDGSLLAGGDARVQAGMTPVDTVKRQHAFIVPHTGRQSPATRPLSAVPPDDRPYPALGHARHLRPGSQLQLGVDRHWLKLEPLWTQHRHACSCSIFVGQSASRVSNTQYVIARGLFLNNDFAHAQLTTQRYDQSDGVHMAGSLLFLLLSVY